MITVSATGLHGNATGCGEAAEMRAANLMCFSQLAVIV